MVLRKHRRKMMNFDSCMLRMNTMSVIFNRKFPCRREFMDQMSSVNLRSIAKSSNRNEQKENLEMKNILNSKRKRNSKKFQVFSGGKESLSFDVKLRGCFEWKTFMGNETETH